MNHAISRFSLDVHSEVSQIQLDVRRWETARSLYINLTENGIPYEIAEGCTAEIAIEKPDGSILKNNCQIIESEIRYDFTSRTTVSVGMLDCEIRLLDNSGNLLTSPRFSILVHSTIYDNGDAVEQEIVNANTVKSANPGYAEVFMWSDGNPTGEDRVGYFVTADMERSAAMVKKADAESEVRGVSMATPGFASNGGSTRYDEQSNLIRNYCYVGLLGFAPVIDNGTCTVNGRCSPGADGTAVPDTTGNGYLVADRVDDTHVLILLEASSNVRINNLPGVIYPYSGANIPDGFLLCDGAAYSRTEYAELFAAIGTMYGSGDGSTTFNVPDLVERVPAGAGDNHAAGEMVGEETHTLTVDEMPSHNHTSNDDAAGLFSGWGTESGDGWITAAIAGTDGGNWTTDYTGGSQPHNNMQPTTYIRGYIIATGKGSGVSVQDIIAGVQALPLGIEYGGTGATDAKTARENLGIKDVARNLLDNSNFTNPVNQRSEAVYNGIGYTIDRWILYEQNALVEIEERCISVVGKLFQVIDDENIDRTKTHTLATCNNNGDIRVISGIPNIGFSDDYLSCYVDNTDNHVKCVLIGDRRYEWAALYEGEYTAETLPVYRPKVYCAERAECRRYYKRYGSNITLSGWLNGDASQLVLGFDNSDMRIVPTVAGTISAGKVGSGRHVNASYLSFSSINRHEVTLNNTLTSAESNATASVRFSSLTFDADL